MEFEAPRTKEGEVTSEHLRGYCIDTLSDGRRLERRRVFKKVRMLPLSKDPYFHRKRELREIFDKNREFFGGITNVTVAIKDLPDEVETLVNPKLYFNKETPLGMKIKQIIPYGKNQFCFFRLDVEANGNIRHTTHPFARIEDGDLSLGKRDMKGKLDSFEIYRWYDLLYWIRQRVLYPPEPLGSIVTFPLLPPKSR